MSDIKSLFQIEQEYLNLASKLEELEFLSPEEEKELLDELQINKEEFVRKADNYKYIIDLFQNEANIAKAEIERIKKFQEGKEKAVEKLKGILLQALLLYGTDDKGIKRFSFNTLKLSTRRSSSTSIDFPDLVPDQYRNHIITITQKGAKDAINKIASILNKAPDEIKEKIVIKTTNELFSKPEFKKLIEEDNEVEGVKIVENYSLTIK